MKQILYFSLLLSNSLFAEEQTISNLPVINIFELGVMQGQTMAYNVAAKDNITRSLNEEKGTLAMFSVKQKNNPETAYMIEIYSNEANYQSHINSSQYKFFLQKSPDILKPDHKIKINLTPRFLGDKKVYQTDKTINNLVVVDVKPEFNKGFGEIVIPEMVQSLKIEDGVLAMYASVEKERPNRWYFYEIYASEKAYQLHRKTPHFLYYLKNTAQMTTYKNAIPVSPSFLMNKGGLDFNEKQ